MTADVLVVDDSLTVRMDLSAALTGAGMHVVYDSVGKDTF